MGKKSTAHSMGHGGNIITKVLLASLLSGKVWNAERGAVLGELGRQLCSDRGGVQKGRAGEVG